VPNCTWIKRDVSHEVLASDDWLSLNLAERGLLESVIRAIILTGPLPDDAKLIARRTGADVAEVKNAWPAVKRLLRSDESGKLVHAETLAAIRAAEDACDKIRLRTSAAGKASGESRKRSEQDVQHDAEHVVQQSQSQSQDLDQDQENTDSDYPPTNRKNRDSQPDTASVVRQLEDLIREHLMAPTKSSLGRIIEAAPHKTPAEAITAITAAVTRGYGGDSKNGPRSFRWFEQVVREYWTDREQRDFPPRGTAMDTGGLGDLDNTPF
jgi:hypothetical protein